MGSAFGIYDKHTGSLTDLGHVLRHVAPWSPRSNASPFIWDDAARWIGFSILFQAAGDILVAFFRQWPEHPASNDELVELLRTIGRNLARRAVSDEHEQLLLLLNVYSGKDGRETIFPYLEPLRELGYLQRQQIAARSYYTLTERGNRVKNHLGVAPKSVDVLLRDGVSRLFLHGEGVDSLHAANGEAVRRTLVEMPDEFMVLGQAEVSLDAVVLLTQAELISREPGAWIDQTSALHILRQIEPRSGGRLFLKHGMLIHETNVAWSDGSILQEPGLWQTIDNPALNSTHEDEESLPAEEIPRDFQDVADVAVNHAESLDGADPMKRLQTDIAVSTEADTALPVVDDGSLSTKDDANLQLPEGTAASPRDMSDVPDVAVSAVTPAEGSRRSDGDPGDECAGNPSLIASPISYVLTAEGFNGALRLWLHFVDALLEPVALGGTHTMRWGGLNAALMRLHALVLDLPDTRLEEKRKPLKDDILDPDGKRVLSPLVLRPVQCLKESLTAAGIGWLANQITDTWRSVAERRLVRVVIERCIGQVETASLHFREKIEAFLNASGPDLDWANWSLISEITRAALHDALALGRWNYEELRSRLHSALRVSQPHEAVQQWLDVVFCKRRSIRYIQRRAFLLEDVARLGLDELAQLAKSQKLPPGIDVRGPLAQDAAGNEGPDLLETSCRFEFAIDVVAASSYEAKILGRDRVHTLLIAHYAQNTGTPGADTTVSLLPDIPPFETVEGVDDGPIDLETDGLLRRIPTARSAPHLGKLHDLFMPSAWTRKGTPDSRQRALRARRGLILSRDPDRRPEERLALAWAAVEQLITAGENSKGDSITALASATSLLQMRRMFKMVYIQAWRALRICYVLNPEDSLLPILNEWMTADVVIELRRQAPLVLPVRKSFVVRSLVEPSVTEEEALKFLMQHRDELLNVRDIIMPYVPFASNLLHNFIHLTGDGKRPGLASKPHPLGSGKALVEAFDDVYLDSLSFFSHVYELRNRFVHSGDGFDLSREPAAGDAYERFVALSLPLMDAIQIRIDNGASLEDIWLLAQVLAKDLRNLPQEQIPMTADRLSEILAF